METFRDYNIVEIQAGLPKKRNPLFLTANKTTTFSNFSRDVCQSDLKNRVDFSFKKI